VTCIYTKKAKEGMHFNFRDGYGSHMHIPCPGSGIFADPKSRGFTIHQQVREYKTILECRMSTSSESLIHGSWFDPPEYRQGSRCKHEQRSRIVGANVTCRRDVCEESCAVSATVPDLWAQVLH
jgi:hypothetical protein